MKYLITLIFTLFGLTVVHSQTLTSFKLKTPINSKERTEILNEIRIVFQAELKKSYNYRKKIIFVVKQLNVSGEYAWFEADIVDKKGDLIPNLEGEPENDVGLAWNSCGEALLKKKNKKWIVLESQTFPLIPWWEDIKERNPEVPCRIFGESLRVVKGCWEEYK